MTSTEANIAARREAESLVELAGEQPARFWDTLIRLAQEKLPVKPDTVDPFAPLTDEEAIRFERTTMPYGRFGNQEIGVVPCDYIGWMVENNFAIDLRRYVKSERFKRRQDQE